MSRKFLFALLAGMLILSACSTALTGALPATESPATQPPDSPVSSNDPGAKEPEPEPWRPAPGDEDLIRGEAEIDRAEIISLESFPPQFMLQVAGWKGNPCSLLRAEISEPDAEGRVDVEVYVLTDPAALCAQVLEGYDVTLPLPDDEPGDYRVYLNGQLVGDYTVPQS